MRRFFSFLAVLAVVTTAFTGGSFVVLSAQGGKVPQYEPDTTWPPKLPNDWVWGVPTGVAVDKHDNVWVLHRPRMAMSATAAPSVVVFDKSGKFVRAWGGPGQGFDWPDTEHGIFVDHQDNVWITGINPRAGADVSKRIDDMLLKFTKEGKFLLQIGGRDSSKGNKDFKNAHQSAEVFVYAKTNEAVVADGYGNRRVWVIDNKTGAHKRYWGAFGKEPIDVPQPTGGGGATPPPGDTSPEGPEQFGIVHGLKVSNDGLIYVADRGNRRIQVFDMSGKYLKQGFVNRTTSTSSCATVVFSQDKAQQFVFCPDFNKGEVAVLNRQTLETIGSFASRGAAPGQLQNVHSMAIDSKGNLYTAEVAPGRRLQKFAYKGLK